MPSTPNLTVISNQHANTPNSVDPWITLLHVYTPARNSRPAVHLYAAAQDEDIVYQGNTYKAFQFEFPELQATPGQLPQFQVRVQNVDRTAHSLLEEYNGATSGIATFMIVSAMDLDGASPAQEWQFEIMSAVAEDSWATLSLGGENPMRRAVPTCMYSYDHCNWTYNSPARRAALDPSGASCAYQGSLATCDHTSEGANGCRAHGNLPRFGAHRGIANLGFRTATIAG